MLEGYHFCLDASASAERIQVTNGLFRKVLSENDVFTDRGNVKK